MKKATSFTLDENLLSRAEEVGKAIGRSKSWVMESAIKLGLPHVVSAENNRVWEETRKLSEVLAESLHRDRKQSKTKKPPKQSQP